eukprot:SAG31_NODE_27904_length_418_cov_1.128527_1_plen_32_part_10
MRIGEPLRRDLRFEDCEKRGTAERKAVLPTPF